ncbi:MAG TPA: NUDIX hydrolase [Spirochaetes bacterium]|nr:NUDIX hydrolase [Spirochaetota bacterium]
MKHTVNNSEIVFNEFFKIEKAGVCWEQFDGTMGAEQNRYVIRRGDSVGIVPVCENNKIILIKQFRYPAALKYRDGYLWEIPAGMVDGSEGPVEAAVRELKEEIGIEISEVQPLISFFLSPGALDEKFHLFFARVGAHLETGSVGGNKQEYENLKIVQFDKTELFEMIEKNDIVDAKTVAALLYYFSKEKQILKPASGSW